MPNASARKSCECERAAATAGTAARIALTLTLTLTLIETQTLAMTLTLALARPDSNTWRDEAAPGSQRTQRLRAANAPRATPN